MNYIADNEPRPDSCGRERFVSGSSVRLIYPALAAILLLAVAIGGCRSKRRMDEPMPSFKELLADVQSRDRLQNRDDEPKPEDLPEETEETPASDNAESDIQKQPDKSEKPDPPQQPDIPPRPDALQQPEGRQKPDKSQRPDKSEQPDTPEQPAEANDSHASEQVPVETEPSPDVNMKPTADKPPTEPDEQTPPPAESNPLDEPVSCLLTNATIEESCEMLSTLRKVNIVPSPEVVRFCKARHRRVTLCVNDMPLSGALDWMVRQVDAGYVVDPDFGVVIVRGYEWLAGEELTRKAYSIRTSVRFKRAVQGLYDVGWEHGVAIDLAKRFLRIPEKHCPGSAMQPGPGSNVLLISAPESGHEIMRQLCSEMARGDKKSSPPPKPVQEGDVKDLKALCEKSVSCRFADELVTDIAAELSRRSGVSIGFDPRYLPDGLEARVTLTLGRVPFAVAVEFLAREAGLGKPRLEPGRGIWIYRDKNPVRWPRDGRLFWDRASVRSFYVGRLLEEMSPQEIVEAVRANVTSGEWDEFGPVAGYYPNGRLIVLHDDYGHRRVAEYLRGLGTFDSDPSKGQ